MNGYDFDGTIYAGDSSVDFFLFALKTKPSLLIRRAPKQALGFALYFLKIIGKTRLKEYFFSFLSAVDAPKLTDAFWERESVRAKIGEWYLARREPTDVVISASPEFLLRPICRRLGIERLIASNVDSATGKFRGKNCRGAEKVRRLQTELGIDRLDQFYSDSASDLPLARLADKAFYVKNGRVAPWSVDEK